MISSLAIEWPIAAMAPMKDCVVSLSADGLSPMPCRIESSRRIWPSVSAMCRCSRSSTCG